MTVLVKKKKSERFLLFMMHLQFTITTDSRHLNCVIEKCREVCIALHQEKSSEDKSGTEILRPSSVCVTTYMNLDMTYLDNLDTVRF